jgi:hypothetical protein
VCDDATDFFAIVEVTPIAANAKIHSLRLKLNWATDSGRVISFAAQRSQRHRKVPQLSWVLRGEAAKQLSSVATDGGSMAVVRKDPETATGQCRCTGGRRHDRHLRSGDWILSKRQ